MPQADSRAPRRGPKNPHRGPHRRVSPRSPATKSRNAKWPEVLRVTKYQLQEALEGRRGLLWARIRRTAIVAGYAWTIPDNPTGPTRCARWRIRDLRRDGAESLLAMLVALLYCADIRTGFVGRPRDGGGPWERYTLEDLAKFAYNAKDEGSVRRARRAIDVLINLGVAHPNIQVNRYDEEVHAVRGEPAVRRLNWALLCELTNTTWYLKKAQEHAAAKALAARERARKNLAKTKANTTAALRNDTAYVDAIAYADTFAAAEPGDQADSIPFATGDPPGS